MSSKGIIHADVLKIGDELWSESGDVISITHIEKFDSDIVLYDILNVGTNNIFYVDGIVSHNCSFVSSGNSVVPLETLKYYEENFVKAPVEKRGFDTNYWTWAFPDYSKTYVVSADVSRGDGEDFSTFHVLEIESMTQVAEYRGKLETKDFGNLLVQVATEWNNALLIVENSNIGWAVIQQILDRGYQNLFYMDDDLKYVDMENQYTNKWNAKSKRATAGFTMSSRTRPLVISKIDLYFMDKGVIIQSMRTINELMTFIWKNGKAQAADGYNDDLTIALGIGLWVRDTALMLRQKGMDLQRQALAGIKKSGFEENGIYSSTNMPGFRQPGSPTHDPYKQQVSSKEVQDLRWLIR